MSDASHTRARPQGAGRSRLTALERVVASKITDVIAAHEREGINIAKSVINIAREYLDTWLAMLGAVVAPALARHQAEKHWGWQ